MLDATFRRFAIRLVAVGGVILTGCHEPPSLLSSYLHPLEQAGQPPVAVAAPAAEEVQLVNHETPPAPVVAEAAPQVLPINLDTVLRLAEKQNRDIALARERLNQSEIERQLAADSWLPKIDAGIGYYRHEGPYQNEDGTLTRSSFSSLFPGVNINSELDVKEATYCRVNACREVWQQKGEVSRITNDTLLEAATTYIDLLAARRAESVNDEITADDRDLLDKAKKGDPGRMAFFILSVQTELDSLQQAKAKLHHDGDAASVKLAYLLGLPCRTELVPLDKCFSPIDLVDASPGVDDLIHRAVTSGPGVYEMEGLLETITNGMAQMEGPMKYLPTLQINATEGDFGGGPGSRLDWGNRLDLCLQARWNLTEFITARKKQQLAQSKLAQAHLTFDDLQAKLAMGVQDARDAILNGQQQIIDAGKMVKDASETYQKSKDRFFTGGQLAGGSVTEVMQMLHVLEQSHSAYVQAIRDYNKAQIRLMLLLGPTACAVGK